MADTIEYNKKYNIFIDKDYLERQFRIFQKYIASSKIKSEIISEDWSNDNEILVTTSDGKVKSSGQTITDAISGKMNVKNPEGIGSVKIGDSCRVDGTNSAAIGKSCATSGNYSFAVGLGNAINKNYSFAEGQENIANENYSHVEGLGNKTVAEYQHIQGKYADTTSNGTSKYIDIIGKGSEAAPNNIEATDFNGNKYVSGNMYFQSKVNGTTEGESGSDIGYLVPGVIVTTEEDYPLDPVANVLYLIKES